MDEKYVNQGPSPTSEVFRQHEVYQYNIRQVVSMSWLIKLPEESQCKTLINCIMSCIKTTDDPKNPRPE